MNRRRSTMTRVLRLLTIAGALALAGCVVYQKDLGPNTAELARKIARYDPGDGWVAVPDK